MTRRIAVLAASVGSLVVLGSVWMIASLVGPDDHDVPAAHTGSTSQHTTAFWTAFEVPLNPNLVPPTHR